ncbi:MAG: sodium ion-translocating decarboxylase subunit beta [Verrucomicrobiae bacterium]|nr:sodium ion-translocating decarboxylase subunit beta [Verrucomicrobiae bacterium]
MIDSLLNLVHLTGFPALTWQMVIMWGVVITLLYLGVYKGFEPLLLVPIAFGALLANLPTQGLVNEPPGAVASPQAGLVESIVVKPDQKVKEGDLLAMLRQADGQLVALKSKGHGTVDKIKVAVGQTVHEGEPLLETYGNEPGGLYYYLYKGISCELFPPLIFLGVGALTDFGPLIANPRTLLLGAAAQLGVFCTFIGALLLGFTAGQAASIGIIGGADGPTAIFLTSKLAPDLLSPIAVAAYSYMALVPLIQPPIMRALTTEKERKIRMKSLRHVSQLERLIFCLMVTVFVILLVPAASALVGMLMLGNFLRECNVTERLVKASQNEIINVITIFLGTSVGITMTAERFIQWETIKIVLLGVVAFGLSTAGGVLMAKLMNVFSKQNPINPLIGAAGVSAVPMAARVAHVEGQKADRNNYLLMHAMGPNVAGVIGTAVAAGYYLATLSR